MTKENILSVGEKVENIDDKLECIINVIAFLDVDGFSFNAKSMSGFFMIVKDLQNEVREVKKLLD